MITNSTKPIKVERFTHQTESEVMEISENACSAFLYQLDLVVSGQSLSVGPEGPFNIMYHLQ